MDGKIDGQSWPLLPIVLEHIARATGQSGYEATVVLHDRLRRGHVRAIGPLTGSYPEPIDPGYWQFHYPNPYGGTSGYDETANGPRRRFLTWFRINANDVLREWPLPAPAPAPVEESAAVAADTAPATPGPGPGLRVKLRDAAANAMIEAVRIGRISARQLRTSLLRKLAQIYPDAGRDTLTKARIHALRALGRHRTASRSFPRHRPGTDRHAT
jgi:hypothetical protein